MAAPGTKRAKWLTFYLDPENKATFFNGTESARQAGYQCESDSSYSAIGSMNKKYWTEQIEIWLTEEGLSRTKLKHKLLSLLDAKETKFFAHMGEVVEEKDVDALGIQIRALDMALKVKGEYAPEKKEITGPNGGPIVTASIQSEMPAKEAAKIYQRLLKGE
jgi:hypothetical protein